MRNVIPGRAFNYWIGVADTLNELGSREEAQAAAQRASEYARTAAERAHAARLAYFARTDLAVQFTRDANGQSQLVTTRAPHNTADWNSFIEPGDDMRRVQGALQEIDCANPVTRVLVNVNGRRLTLAIPDPSRVLMRNAPSEFVCGPQPGTAVTIDYAASGGAGARTDGIVRGMEFK
jgi:hypothetical protein